jgi:cell pole-organizing protein PopZ
MSAADAQAEPTMEEILASIRRIISEDDSAPAAAPAAEDDGFTDDVLELNEPVAAVPETVSPDFDFDALPTEYEPEQTFDDVVVENRWADPEPVAPIREAYQPPPRVIPETAYQAPPSYPADQGLVSEPVASIAADVFSQLSPSKVFPEVFASGNSVEALVVAMLRPMLKEWLDANLPRIVEDKVETEVARIARRSF